MIGDTTQFYIELFKGNKAKRSNNRSIGRKVRYGRVETPQIGPKFHIVSLNVKPARSLGWRG